MQGDHANGEYLSIRDVSLRFGGVSALTEVSFSVAKGQFFSLIGPNGAGKSSLFNCLSRLYQPFQGSIRFNGIELLDKRAHEIAGLGVGRTFQNCLLFRGMTVLENVETGAYSSSASGFMQAILRTPTLRRSEHEIADRAAELIDFLDLGPLAYRLAGELDFPAQKRVELARALMSQPALLLLDEPAGGLNTTEVRDLMALLETLRERFSLTMLLVEHRMDMVMALSEQICVIDMGVVIANGSPDEVRNDPAVIDAYLGHRRKGAA